MKYFGSDGSDEITASQSVQTSAGFLSAFMVYTDGVNDATVTLYDSKNGASGKTLAKLIVSGDSDYGGRIWPERAFRKYINGIYANISGTGASCIVEYLRAAN